MLLTCTNYSRVGNVTSEIVDVRVRSGANATTTARPRGHAAGNTAALVCTVAILALALLAACAAQLYFLGCRWWARRPPRRYVPLGETLDAHASFVEAHASFVPRHQHLHQHVHQHRAHAPGLAKACDINTDINTYIQLPMQPPESAKDKTYMDFEPFEERGSDYIRMISQNPPEISLWTNDTSSLSLDSISTPPRRIHAESDYDTFGNRHAKFPDSADSASLTLPAVEPGLDANFSVLSRSFRRMLGTTRGSLLRKNQLLLDERDVDCALDQHIGQGKFGRVYLGYFRGAQCAFKQVSDAVHYMQEGGTLFEVTHHPNITHFYGMAVVDNRYFLVMQFFSGGSIEKCILEKSFSMAQKVEMILQLTSGLNHLHKKGFIHGDLALRNCLISLRGDSFQCAIGDFGLTKRSPCQQPVSILAPRWSSPLLLSTKIITFASDIWALGCVYTEVFRNGKKPYAGLELRRVVPQLAAYKLKPRVSLQWPRLFPPLMARIFEFDPDERITTDELQQNLFNEYRKRPSSALNHSHLQELVVHSNETCYQI